MESDFVFFGPVHLAIIGAIPLISLLLAVAARRFSRLRVPFRAALAASLVTNEVLYYCYLGWFDTPATLDGLPLQLCNLMVWITASALICRTQILVECAWYLGAFGPTIGLLLPQLWAPTASYPTVQFFFGHAAVLVAIIYLAASGEARPTVRGAAFAFAGLNGIGLVLGFLNSYLGTNYMFLKSPPEGTLFFALFAPPVHIIVGEAVAIAAFAFLALPFRRTAEKDHLYAAMPVTRSPITSA